MDNPASTAASPGDGDATPPAHVSAYWAQGFAIVRGVFDAAEVAELADAFDRIRAEGMRHPRSFRHGNVFFRIGEDARLGRTLRYMQWPAYIDPVLDRYRTDPRMLAIVAPLIGRDLKQIINQMHWKPPGAAMAEFGWHQDIRFRRPREAYRRPGESYVQTGIAVDRHRLESGAMRICPGSHRLGEVNLGDGRVMDRPLDDADLARIGLDPAAAVTLDLDPGDVALWHLFTLHGSGPNCSAADRRLYINGYVDAAMCDRGESTFRDGRPVALGAPVLVHWEKLHVRPEPHYVDD
ncbi:MAG TPA: phytanoyl-CoA dioxygenase family protein [Rhodospirillales bacterium]|nr:phytanoyl-CoA dioxygenase family protein [Rhodospirillales bacterium]